MTKIKTHYKLFNNSSTKLNFTGVYGGLHVTEIIPTDLNRLCHTICYLLNP